MRPPILCRTDESGLRCRQATIKARKSSGLANPESIRMNVLEDAAIADRLRAAGIPVTLQRLAIAVALLNVRSI